LPNLEYELALICASVLQLCFQCNKIEASSTHASSTYYDGRSCKPLSLSWNKSTGLIGVYSGASINGSAGMTNVYIARLKEKIEIDPRTACWNWTASLRPTGYGQMRYLGTTELAHRVSWMLFRGPIPKADGVYGTMNVLHHCDNPKCVNPDHLFIGDQADNAKDAVAKDRWGKRGCKGEQHGRARLTEAKVLQIRSSRLSTLSLARRYRISKSAIQHVLKRRSWTHI
jgi:hypothetical protein